MYFKQLGVISIGFLIALAPATSAYAKDLSGDKGKMRAMGDHPRDGCAKFFKRYIAASGHSAYATTVTGQGSGAICAISLNKRSIEQAEREAIKACESGDNYWKVEQLGGCYVGASK